MISRDGLRSSTPPSRIDASARLTKSTGTYQSRPSRAGAAGSEIIRPATEASGCCVESTIVCGAGGDRQAAGGGVLADRQVEQPREIVEREHLLAAERARRQRPPRVTRDDGVGKRGGGCWAGRAVGRKHSAAIDAAASARTFKVDQF